jgi:hypothetical protein
MRVRYRVLLSKPWWASEKDGWEIGGVVCGTSFLDPYPVMGIKGLEVERHVWNYIERRAAELKVSLENAEEAFGKYADRYKLLPEIHEIEGASFGEIVEELYERYVAAPAKSELEGMRQLEEAELDVVAV